MGKIAAASFVLSSLSLLNQAGLLQGKGTIIIVIVTLIWSSLQLSYDIYVFLANPYSLRQKLLDLTLSTLLGSLYEEKRANWSFKWLHCFCNPFIADFYVYNKWHYLMLMEKGKSDPRKWRTSTRIYQHAPQGGTNGEEVDTSVHIFVDMDDWQNELAIIGHLWEVADYGANHGGETVYMKRFFTVKDKLVKVVVETDWIGTFSYSVKISDLHSTHILTKYEGACRDLRCAVNLFTAWEWFSRQPGCGVIDCRKGGLRRGSKFLHTADLRHMHTTLASGQFELYVCQHEDHGFYVAGP